MAPSPTTQQDLDFLERIGKAVGASAIIATAFAGSVRWLRHRRAKKERQYAERIERIVRAAFDAELRSMNTACENLSHVSDRVERLAEHTTAIQDAISQFLAAGDETFGIMLSLIRANTDWIDDLQSFIDHAHGIDRRSSMGAERRQRLDEKYDEVEERRMQRRRAADRLRELPAVRDGHGHSEVT